MKKMKIAIILASFSLMMGNALAEDRVVAKFNGKAIYKSEVENNLRSMFNGALPDNKKDLDDLDKNFKQRVVMEYVNREVLADKAMHSNIKKSDLYQKQLKAAQNHIAVGLYLDHYAKRRVKDSAVRSEYNNYVKALKNNDELRVSHILVNNESIAHDLYNKIKSGQITFESAAKENSLDNSKVQGGEIGLISRGQTVPEFEEKAYSLKKGEISEPVKTQFGWHIVKVSDIKKRKIPSFEEAKQSVEQSVLMKIKQKYISDLMKESKVEIY
ncbi:MAG: peptidylprolyl isomerase [Alphaproteobacteria bacterium]|nr:peptidylprolyl isomerase [Alphaproteobacteria bacterium]